MRRPSQRCRAAEALVAEACRAAQAARLRSTREHLRLHSSRAREVAASNLRSSLSELAARASAARASTSLAPWPRLAASRRRQAASLPSLAALASARRSLAMEACGASSSHRVGPRAMPTPRALSLAALPRPLSPSPRAPAPSHTTCCPSPRMAHLLAPRLCSAPPRASRALAYASPRSSTSLALWLTSMHQVCIRGRRSSPSS